MASYLLIIGDREALGWILTESRTAFPSAGRSEVATVTEGDELFLYTTRGCFKNPTRDRGRVIGTATVAGPVKHLAEPARFGDRDFPVGCDLEVGRLAGFGEGIALQPLVEHLDAFKRSAHAWSIQLRRPLLRLSDDDANLLSGRLADATLSESTASYTRWWKPPATPMP
jgi:hypothetical protein